MGDNIFRLKTDRLLERDIRGEIVYELSPDGRARRRLRGGRGGAAGQQVLVLTMKAARR